jgi:hypothetical protein
VWRGGRGFNAEQIEMLPFRGLVCDLGAYAKTEAELDDRESPYIQSPRSTLLKSQHTAIAFRHGAPQSANRPVFFFFFFDYAKYYAVPIELIYARMTRFDSAVTMGTAQLNR